MSLPIELQRRNVIRVAIAYLAGSWLLIQVAETLLPIYGFADSAIRLLVAILGIGFVIAIVFAWVFELTPDGIKMESEVDRSQSVTTATGKKLDRAIIVILLAALMYFAFDKLILSESRIETARQEGRTEALVESYGEKSIAVLPFFDMSSAGDQEYMGDGIAEELLNQLAKIPELRVISRSSAFSFKGKNLDIPTIAEQLDVVHILEGSVRKAGNTIRITAQLIDARSDTHLWSETYDRELTDIFAIQDEISASVVDELKITLLGARPTLVETDLAAYELFLQARYFHENMSAENLEKALVFYKAALELDPTYVRAWVWLAAAYGDTINYLGQMPPEEALALMVDSIDRAVAIDPDDPLVIGLQGGFAVLIKGDIVEGTAKLQRALELEPSNLRLLRWSAMTLGALHRYDEGIAVGEYILARDPLGTISIENLAESYLRIGRYEDTIEILEKSIELAPNISDFSWYLAARAAVGLRNADGASAYAEKITKLNLKLEVSAIVYFLRDEEAKFNAAIAEILEAATTDPVYVESAAGVYAHIGDIESAFIWLEQMPVGRFVFVEPDIRWANLHDDPRWEQLLQVTGISLATLDNIEFEVTLPN